MSDINSFTTIILHDSRKKLGLSCNEYCVADYIDTTKGVVTRQEIADRMGISKQAVINILSSLQKKELITKDDATKKIASSEKWKKNIDSHEEKKVQVIQEVEKPSTFKVPWRPSKPFIPFLPGKE